jgi:hypothetical protein
MYPSSVRYEVIKTDGSLMSRTDYQLIGVEEPTTEQLQQMDEMGPDNVMVIDSRKSPPVQYLKNGPLPDVANLSSAKPGLSGTVIIGVFALGLAVLLGLAGLVKMIMSKMR